MVNRTMIEKKEKTKMRKMMNKVALKTGNVISRVKAALKNERGDFYISDGVKIIIAVVLGALLLGALTTIFNTTVIPRITQEITELFGN
jgi:hypothetical protein